jgi:hypothetical protein
LDGVAKDKENGVNIDHRPTQVDRDDFVHHDWDGGENHKSPGAGGEAKCDEHAGVHGSGHQCTRKH